LERGLALGGRDAEKHHRHDEEELHRSLSLLAALGSRVECRKAALPPVLTDNARPAKKEDEI